MTFLAKNAVPDRVQKLDQKEDITVALYPLDEIPALIRNGAISHSLVVAVFSRFDMEYRP